ncbi:hypothetical protein WDW86_10860 [Bdellovibrionota bacterium FG-2]
MKKYMGLGISVFCMTLGVSVLYPMGCSETKPPVSTGVPAQPPSEAGQAGYLIRIEADSQEPGDTAFGVNPLEVTQGTTITWENADTTEHIVTSDNAVWPPITLVPGDKGSVTFSNLGTFRYHCSIHPDMTGTINVVAPPSGE